MSEPTYNDGTLESDDVIQAADYTGYLSGSDYISGDNGFEPDFTDTDSGGFDAQ